MDFAEFTLSLSGSGVECGNGVGWKDGVKGSADHFQWESVGYELETGSRMHMKHSMDNSGNK